MTHQHQLERYTYCVFDTPEECRAAFERAKKLGMETYDNCKSEETELCFSEILGNQIVAYHTYTCEVLKLKKIPAAEFLARMEGTWQGAKNADSTQLFENPEQLTLLEAIAKLEKEGWKLFGKNGVNRNCYFLIRLTLGGIWLPDLIDDNFLPKSKFPTAPAHLQQAIAACELLNNAKQ